ncbi:MAG: hypothetical protein IJ139_06295 [Bacteroidaceae bacterium]|nr:hypothetical protein [Bacteroidaceae bacterium]
MIQTEAPDCSLIEEMEQTCKYVMEFNVNRLLYAINSRKMDSNAVELIDRMIGEQVAKLNKNKTRLLAITSNFNTTYPRNDGSEAIDTTQRITRRIKGGLIAHRRTIKTFTKKSRRRPPHGKTSVPAIHNSALTTEHMEDLFGLDSYPPCVANLFATMIEFCTLLGDCIQETLNTLSDEQMAREDKERMRSLLDECLRQSIANQRLIIGYMRHAGDDRYGILSESNTMLEEYKRARTDEAKMDVFAPKYFHNCTRYDTDRIAIYEAIEQAGGNTELMQCAKLCNCDNTKAGQIITCIKHFDTLLPNPCPRGVIPGMHLHVFMKWCSDDVKQGHFLPFFERLYTKWGGTLSVPGPSSLSNISQQYARGTQKYRETESKMHERIANLLQQYH